MRVPEPRTEKNRLHPDLVTDGPLDDEVSRLTGLGARPVEVRQDPASMQNPGTWAVLEDPESHVLREQFLDNHQLERSRRAGPGSQEWPRASGGLRRAAG